MAMQDPAACQGSRVGLPLTGAPSCPGAAVHSGIPLLPISRDPSMQAFPHSLLSHPRLLITHC